jgi:predicted outer membrane repeat protein
LREAIDLADARSGTQTINFNLMAEGDVTLLLTESLPPVTDPVVIQGPLERRILISGNNQRRVMVASKSFTLQNLTLKDGAAGGEPAGALYVNGLTEAAQIDINNCTFTGNGAFQGGAILVEAHDFYCKINITNSTFAANTASGYGAAVFAGTSGTGTADVLLTGCTFNANTATNWGGALAVWETGQAMTGTVANCTFSDNEAGDVGSALVAYNGANVSIESSTFVANTASNGGAVYVTGASSASSRNSLYSGNSGPAFVNEGTLISQGYNMFNDNPDGFTATGDQINKTTLANFVGPLADNGGPTQTHALLAGSPAIGAGSTALTVDQRGLGRPLTGAPDIGAYEYSSDRTPPTVAVTSPANGAFLK